MKKFVLDYVTAAAEDFGLKPILGSARIIRLRLFFHALNRSYLLVIIDWYSKGGLGKSG